MFVFYKRGRRRNEVGVEDLNMGEEEVQCRTTLHLARHNASSVADDTVTSSYELNLKTLNAQAYDNTEVVTLCYFSTLLS